MIVFTSGEDSPGCAAGVEGRRFYETGHAVTLSPLDDDCGFRTFLTVEVGPLASAEPVDPLTLPSGIELTGHWGQADTGAVFEADKYWLIADGAVIDQGTYLVLSSPYRLVLVSISSEPGCEEGAYAFFLRQGETLFIEAPEEETCPARLPNAFQELSASEPFELPEPCA